MDKLPAPKPGILDIAPYVGGRSSAPGVSKVYKLSSNEGALGASPKAVEAFQAASAKLAAYPEGSAALLRDEIARTYGLDAARIVCGNGSDELLTLLANAYLQPGDEVLFSRHAFLVYKIATLSNSAVPVVVDETDLKVDVAAMLAAVTPRTKLVYVANPNNPTGSYLTAEELRRLHAGLPSNCLLVIDAAYGEYVRRNDYTAGIDLVAEFDNVVMTRTFSKIYGLAGLRVGWAFCPAAVADVLHRIRGPFNVSIPAQLAAVAALQDRQHLESSISHNETWRARLTQDIRALGLRVDESVGNFVLVHFPETQGRTAQDADQFLMARGVIVRLVTNYALPNALRITIGPEEANEQALAALKAFLA